VGFLLFLPAVILIVPRYAQVLDQNRLDAIKKLEELKKSTIGSHEVAEGAADETIPKMRQ
jgi:transcription initiation factor TFIID subunit TAF12